MCRVPVACELSRRVEARFTGSCCATDGRVDRTTAGQRRYGRRIATEDGRLNKKLWYAMVPRAPQKVEHLSS